MAKDCKVCHGEGIVYTDRMDLDTHSLCHACNKEDESSFEMIEDDMPSFEALDKAFKDWAKLIEGEDSKDEPKDQKFIVVNNDHTLKVFDFYFSALRYAIETPNLMCRNIYEVDRKKGTLANS